MVNPFAADGYSMAGLSDAIGKMPNLYGRLNEMALFTPKGVREITVLVEQRNGTLNLVTSTERGAPSALAIHDKRALRAFKIPHFSLDDVILPQDVQGIRAFGSENDVLAVAEVMRERLQRLKDALDQTTEYLRMGALKGIILDADGSTIYNLYTEFGISAKTVSFALADEETDVLLKCLEVKRHIEANLKGERMAGVRVLVDGDFYDALTTHPKVEKAFAAYMALSQNLADDYRRGFRFGGLVFEEYPGTWTDKDGTTRLAIADSCGHAFPEGTANTFRTYVAPGNFMAAVNAIGQQYYAMQEPKKMDAGWDLHAETNPLPMCLRPEVLVQVTVA